MQNPSFYSALAQSIIAGWSDTADAKTIAARITQALDVKERWIRPLAVRLLRAFPLLMRPRRRDVIAFLRADKGLRDAESRHAHGLRIVRQSEYPAQMQPALAARSWPLPSITTVGELAAWLCVDPQQLAWFADLKDINGRAPMGPLHHYHYRVLAKHGGSIRLIESPKQHLKQLQRVILRELLEKIPVHSTAHGFVSGRSIKTFAAPHVGQRVVLRMDLEDFFPSISRARVQALFRTAGYPETLADLFGGILCNAVPRAVWKRLGNDISPNAVAAARMLYARPHLPQGSPSSPAVANLCSWRVDCRLNGLAKAAGAQYTRYADDLAFSGGGEFERGVERFAARAAAILMEEGFREHHRKTRVMRHGVRQYLAGIVTNERMNVPRTDFDTLKAILTNCVRHGAESQNREAHPAFRQHLDGRVGFVEMVNAAKGARLRKIFKQITWIP